MCVCVCACVCVCVCVEGVYVLGVLNPEFGCTYTIALLYLKYLNIPGFVISD